MTDCAVDTLTDASAPPSPDRVGAVRTASDPAFEGPVIVLEHRSGWIPIDWKELWRYRELLYFLIWRDVKVRYKQTVLGAAWAALQPLASMLVFTIFFGKLAGIPSDGIPYSIFVLAGLLPWTFFANSVTLASGSLVNSTHLITKVYFPRLMVPSAAVMSGLIDLLISLGIMGLMMAYFRVAPPALAAIVPVLMALTLVVALGVSIWLSALTLAYRDFRFVVPFLVQLWMFCSPVVYPLTMVPEQWRFLLALNPMTGILNAFRSALLGVPEMEWGYLAASALVSVVILASGLAYFKRVERRFADIA